MKKPFTQQLILSTLLVLMSFSMFAQDIVITEIMYNPPESGADTTEFIELYNNTAAAISLENWAFADGVEFVFPDVSIEAGGYIVIAKNDTSFNEYYGFYPLEWDNGGLKNSGETILLVDANGSPVDSVEYDKQNGWPELPAGDGASLVLCDVSTDNNLASSWMAATTAVGITINGKNLLANRGAESACPSTIELNDDEETSIANFTRIFDVLDNDILPGAVASLQVSAPTLGSASVTADNKIEYVSGADCGVSDNFTYTVELEDGQMATANVMVQIVCTPEYSIGLVTTEDADGVADSLETICTLTGIVYGVDFLGGSGIQFAMIDGEGDGIVVRQGNEDLGYTVTEGDEITVIGAVGQYRGLTQFSAGLITLNSSNNTLLAPIDVTQLGEDTESKLVRLMNMHVIDMGDWSDSGSGFNVKITNGSADTIQMRIDNDVDAYANATLKAAVDGATFNLTGLGAQYDNSSPYTGGYQIFPRSAMDFDIVTATNTPSLQNKINIFPNPTNSDIVVTTKDLKVDEMRLVNILGQTLSNVLAPDATQHISLNDFPQGTYFLQITAGNAFTTMKIEKN